MGIWVTWNIQLSLSRHSKSPGSKGEGIVDFEIIIEEGKQFRLRSLKFEGHQLPAEELRRYSALRVGEIYSVGALQDFVNKLNESELFEPIDKDGDAGYLSTRKRDFFL